MDLGCLSGGSWSNGKKKHERIPWFQGCKSSCAWKMLKDVGRFICFQLSLLMTHKLEGAEGFSEIQVCWIFRPSSVTLQVHVPTSRSLPSPCATWYSSRVSVRGRKMLWLGWEVVNWLVVSNIFYFHPYSGKWSNLTNIFQMGWNHQLVKYGGWIWWIGSINWDINSLFATRDTFQWSLESICFADVHESLSSDAKIAMIQVIRDALSSYI